MDLHIINQRLRDLHGVDLLGQPIYRVIWSPDEIEKRFATFTDFLPGTNVFIREVTEVREVQKYSYLAPQYVLEKLFRNQHNKQILDNKTLAPMTCTYEPMWAFGHEVNGRARQVVWRAVELIILAVNNPKVLTPSQMDDVEFKQAVDDEKLMMDLMEEHIPNDSLHSAIRDGDAVMLNQDGRKHG